MHLIFVCLGISSFVYAMKAHYEQCYVQEKQNILEEIESQKKDKNILLLCGIGGHVNKVVKENTRYSDAYTTAIGLDNGLQYSENEYKRDRAVEVPREFHSFIYANLRYTYDLQNEKQKLPKHVDSILFEHCPFSSFLSHKEYKQDEDNFCSGFIHNINLLRDHYPQAEWTIVGLEYDNAPYGSWAYIYKEAFKNSFGAKIGPTSGSFHTITFCKDLQK